MTYSYQITAQNYAVVLLDFDWCLQSCLQRGFVHVTFVPCDHCVCNLYSLALKYESFLISVRNYLLVYDYVDRKDDYLCIVHILSLQMTV